MKDFVRSALLCLLAWIALPGAKAELADHTQKTCPMVISRSLQAARLAMEVLAQRSFFQIQLDDSSDLQIEDDRPTKKRHLHSKGGGDVVVTGESYKLAAGETTNGAVVLIGGTGEINGTVNGDLVLIGGKATLAGTINGDLVTIGSNLTFNAGAVANGDYISVASEVKGEPELTTNGDRVALNGYSPAVPVVKEMLTNIIQLRPMSPTSIFSWMLAIIMLIVGLILGLIFPTVFAGTEAIVRDRPGPSLLVGLAVILGGAVLSFLLAITVIGIIALPFLALAFFILNIFGSTSVCYSIGRRIAPNVGARSYSVYLWIIIGTVVIWVLYCLPVIGFIAAGVVSLIGLGTFAIYLVERYRSDTSRPLLQTGRWVTRRMRRSPNRIPWRFPGRSPQ